MKKLLYGTTALVAAGMIGTGAQAADKIKMGVGGYFQTSLAYGSQDDDAGRRNHKLAREGEIIFNGSTTLDNGIQVGVQVQLEAETCEDQIDETFMWISGAFGRVNLGSENSAPYLMGYASPAPSHWSHGLNSPNFSHTRLFLSSVITLSGDSEKITYFTPRFAGFQLGVSYTPDNNEANRTVVFGNHGSYSGFPSDEDGGEWSELFAVGANYVNKFGDVSVAVSGGYERGKLEAVSGSATDDRTQWNAGARIGFAGFTVGGAYRNDDRGTDDNDRKDWNLGVRYASGPWGVGIQYAQTETDGLDGKIEAWEIGGSYAFGPGMLVVAGVQFWDNDQEGSTTSTDKSTIVFLGTHVAF